MGGGVALTTETFTILCLLHDARVEARLERLIRSHARVRGRSYIEEDDKNQISRVRVAVYLVETDDPRLLKSSLRGLENHRSGLEVFIR